MKNEKGVTLIELLGVLVILSVILILAGSILTSSMKTSNRATTDQRLQQEANYITEAIRNEYLKSEKQKAEETEIEEYIKKVIVRINNDQNQLKLYDRVISEGYIYSFCLETEFENEECKKDKKIDRSATSQTFQLKLTSKDGQRTHEIKTEYSKLK